MKKLLIIALIALSGTTLIAMEEYKQPKFSSYNTYKGQPVTPQNIVPLSRQAGITTPDFNDVVTRYVQKNKPFLQELICLDQPGAIREEKLAHARKATTLLKERGFNVATRIYSIDGKEEELVYPNAVFQDTIEDQTFWVKGNSNVKSNTPYQTVSRMFHMLLALEVVKKFDNKTHQLAPGYLVELRDGMETDPTNERTLFVQENIAGCTSLEQNLGLIKQFSQETIKNHYQLIKEAILWSATKRNILAKADGTIIIVDTESPDDTKKDRFAYGFHGNCPVPSDVNFIDLGKFKAWHDITIAYREFADLLLAARKQYPEDTHIQELCKTFAECLTNDTAFNDKDLLQPNGLQHGFVSETYTKAKELLEQPVS